MYRSLLNKKQTSPMKLSLLLCLNLLLSFNVVAKTVIHAGYLIDGSNDNPMNEMSIYVIENKITEVIIGSTVYPLKTIISI